MVKLIQRRADVNSQDSLTGDTPLHLLVSVFTRNSIAAKKILSFLVEAGADLNLCNLDNWTPLH